MGEMADYVLESGGYWDESDFIDDDGNDINPYPYKFARGPGECPKCKNKTILRKGKYGQFYGCTTFPKCNGSRCLK